MSVVKADIIGIIIICLMSCLGLLSVPCVCCQSGHYWHHHHLFKLPRFAVSSMCLLSKRTLLTSSSCVSCLGLLSVPCADCHDRIPSTSTVCWPSRLWPRSGTCPTRWASRAWTWPMCRTSSSRRRSRTTSDTTCCSSSTVSGCWPLRMAARSSFGDLTGMSLLVVTLA